VLGCSRAAASLIRGGKYPTPDSPLVQQYHALIAVVDQASAQSQKADAESFCRSCPRESCAGCRIAELII